MNTCSTCKFWERYCPSSHSENKHGACRRRAPASFNSIKNPHDEDFETVTALWPTTFEEEWCGEWLPAESEQVPNLPKARPKIAVGPRRVMRTPAVLAATGWAKATLYAKIKEGKFPRGMKLDPGARAVVWFEDEIAALQPDRT